MDKIKTFISKYLTWLDDDYERLALYLTMLNSRVDNINEYAESIDSRLKTIENKGKKKVVKKNK